MNDDSNILTVPRGSPLPPAEWPAWADCEIPYDLGCGTVELRDGEPMLDLSDPRD